MLSELRGCTGTVYVIYFLHPGYKTGLSASYLQNRFDGSIIYFPEENHPASVTMSWMVFGLSGLVIVVVAQLPKCIVSHKISFQFSLIVQIQQDCNRSHHILEY